MMLVMLACCEPGLRSVGDGYCYGMAVIEDRGWDCHFVYRKRSESSSNSTKSGYGHGVSNRRGVVLL